MCDFPVVGRTTTPNKQKQIPSIASPAEVLCRKLSDTDPLLQGFQQNLPVLLTLQGKPNFSENTTCSHKAVFEDKFSEIMCSARALPAHVPAHGRMDRRRPEGQTGARASRWTDRQEGPEKRARLFYFPWDD